MTQKRTFIEMGMPITVEIVDSDDPDLMQMVVDHFDAVNRRFSPYRLDSEIGLINRNAISPDSISGEMREVLSLCERTREETDGYFDLIRPNGSLDPSGIVKGWAIRNAANKLADAGSHNFYVEAGGDIQTAGFNGEGGDWRVGIRSPFKETEIVKIVAPRGGGIATSGSYVRGAHIYNPRRPDEPLDDVVSISVIGPDVLEADRFATAAFAMGREGIHFIEAQPGLEGYAIDAGGIATQTTRFKDYVVS